MTSVNEKQPLLADPELVDLLAQLARQADHRGRVARRVKLAVVAVALFFLFSYSSFISAVSSIVPAWGSPGPSPSDPSSPVSPPSPVDSLMSTPLEGPLDLPQESTCRDYSDGNGLKTYPVATYPLVFDAQHDVLFRQNATHQDKYDNYWRHVRVSGDVVVRKAAAGKEPSVDVEALSNDDRIRTVYTYVASTQSLYVAVDDRIRLDVADDPAATHGHPCLVVRATVWLPDVADSANVHLKNLLVANTHLGIQLIDDTNLVVDKYARLVSVAGTISASRTLATAGTSYHFEAPATDVETASGSISGPWTLRDRLHFGSVSGAIDVAVTPEAVAAKDGVADLSLASTSGAITFEELASADKQTTRAHTLSASSQSGAIRGTGSFARRARLHSTSGAIKASLRPVALAENAAHEHATLDTDAGSGATELVLLDEPAGTPLDFLTSSHTSLSGAVALHYPASWAGGIHLKSLSGSLAATGKGVHVVPDHSPRWPPRMQRQLEATKDAPAGDDTVRTELSNIVAESMSGSVRVSFPM